MRLQLRRFFETETSSSSLNRDAKSWPRRALIQSRCTNASRDTTDKGPPKTGLPSRLHNAGRAENGKWLALISVLWLIPLPRGEVDLLHCDKITFRNDIFLTRREESSLAQNDARKRLFGAFGSLASYFYNLMQDYTLQCIFPWRVQTEHPCVTASALSEVLKRNVGSNLSPYPTPGNRNT